MSGFLPLPPAAHSGELIEAAAFNQLREMGLYLLSEIEKRTPQPSADIGYRYGSTAGFTAFLRPTSSGNSAGFRAQFAIYGVRYDSGAGKYYCKIAPGYLLNINPAVGGSAAEFMGYHLPLIAGIAMTAEPIVEIEWAPGQMIALRVQTGLTDVVRDDGGDPALPLVEVLAAAESELGEHFQPVDPEQSGVEGDYYYKLATFEIDGTDPSLVTVGQYHQGGPIPHRPNLRTFENVGSGAGVFKARNRATDSELFRKIRGDYGIREKEATDEIELDLRAENVGNGAPVYVQPVLNGNPDPDPPDGAAKFRSINEKADSPQIRVSVADLGAGLLAEDILIKGNSYDAAGAGRISSLTVVDGLVTSLAAVAAPSGGWWGEIVWTHGGNGYSTTLEFEDGVLIDVTGDSGTGSGTENDPGDYEQIVG